MSDDYYLIRSHYDRCYHNSFIHEFKNISFIDFYHKVNNMDGDFKETLQLRNLVINGKRNKNNKQDYDRGLLLLNDEQIEYMKLKQVDKGKIINKMYNHSAKRHEEEYFKMILDKKARKEG